MDAIQQKFIQHIIDIGKDMTLATIRPDGFPQATTVSYASDGLVMYVGVGKESQKASNIRQCNKVSLTINAEYVDWDDIKGLSIGAIAKILDDPEEIRHALDCMIKRYPQAAQWIDSDQASNVVVLKMTPQVVSMLDYEQGFGHTELVMV